MLTSIGLFRTNYVEFFKSLSHLSFTLSSNSCIIFKMSTKLDFEYIHVFTYAFTASPLEVVWVPAINFLGANAAVHFSFIIHIYHKYFIFSAPNIDSELNMISEIFQKFLTLSLKIQSPVKYLYKYLFSKAPGPLDLDKYKKCFLKFYYICH